MNFLACPGVQGCFILSSNSDAGKMSTSVKTVMIFIQSITRIQAPHCLAGMATTTPSDGWLGKDGGEGKA